MKLSFSSLKNIGLILTCAFALSSCAALQIQEDRQKLAQLEADYHAGKVRKKDYKQDKGRLEVGSAENKKLMEETVTITYDQPQDDNGGQATDDDGSVASDDSGCDDAGEDPAYVCDDVYYYQVQGRYCYFAHGQRQFVSSLPAGGHQWSRRDGKPHRHTTGGSRRSGMQHQKVQNGQPPAAAKNQQNTNTNNGKKKKDKNQ